MNHFYQAISGQVSEAELDLFRYAISRIPDGGRFIEIGTWFGHCTAFIEVEILNSGKNIELISCDTFPCEKQEDIVRAVAKGFNTKVIKGRSLDLEFPEADCIWLDGDHSYENVKAELEKFWPLVRPGGILCGHDYANFDPYKGVFRAVNEFTVAKDLGIGLFGDYSYVFHAER